MASRPWVSGQGYIASRASGKHTGHLALLLCIPVLAFKSRKGRASRLESHGPLARRRIVRRCAGDLMSWTLGARCSSHGIPGASSEAVGIVVGLAARFDVLTIRSAHSAFVSAFLWTRGWWRGCARPAASR